MRNASFAPHANDHLQVWALVWGDRPTLHSILKTKTYDRWCFSIFIRSVVTTGKTENQVTSFSLYLFCLLNFQCSFVQPRLSFLPEIWWRTRRNHISRNNYQRTQRSQPSGHLFHKLLKNFGNKGICNHLNPISLL